LQSYLDMGCESVGIEQQRRKDTKVEMKSSGHNLAADNFILRASRLCCYESLKFKLVVAYDGTAYQGWQVQRPARACQGTDSRRPCGKMFPA